MYIIRISKIWTEINEKIAWTRVKFSSNKLVYFNFQVPICTAIIIKSTYVEKPSSDIWICCAIIDGRWTLKIKKNCSLSNTTYILSKQIQSNSFNFQYNIIL